jgi:RNA polymerase primary sigma factor
VDSGAIDQVVSILEDDAFRRGGAVTYDRLLSLCTKHRLDPDQIAVVKSRLSERDVGIEGPDDDDDQTHEPSETGAEVPPDAELEEPSAAPPPEAVQDILGAYYRSASGYERLTADEERALARRIHTGFAAAEKLSTPDVADRKALEEFVADGTRARDTLIEANLLLVPFVAKSIEGRDALPPEDLIQEGNLGLMRAADRFDGALHDTRFSTYACWWIWSFMKRGLIDRGRLVRLPVHFAERIPRLLKARRALTRERDGTPPSVTELAEHVGWRIEHVIFALQALEDPMRLDTPLEDGKGTVVDRLIASVDAQPDVTASRHQEERLLVQLVESLETREAYVLKERFGLGGGQGKTLEEIGAQMGVTRERVRQIESKALERLRHPSKRQFWSLFGIQPEASLEEDEDEEEGDEENG